MTKEEFERRKKRLSWVIRCPFAIVSVAAVATAAPKTVARRLLLSLLSISRLGFRLPTVLVSIRSLTSYDNCRRCPGPIPLPVLAPRSFYALRSAVLLRDSQPLFVPLPPSASCHFSLLSQMAMLLCVVPFGLLACAFSATSGTWGRSIVCALSTSCCLFSKSSFEAQEGKNWGSGPGLSFSHLQKAWRPFRFPDERFRRRRRWRPLEWAWSSKNEGHFLLLPVTCFAPSQPTCRSFRRSAMRSAQWRCD